jgi:hypothetical protein
LVVSFHFLRKPKTGNYSSAKKENWIIHAKACEMCLNLPFSFSCPTLPFQRCS